MGQPGSFFFPYKRKSNPRINVPDMEDGKPGDYLTDALTTKPMEFMKQTKGQPFFLNMWYYPVHTPVTGKEDTITKYENKLETMRVTAPAKAESEHDAWSREMQDNPVYAAMVESMDENVGRIRDYLETSGRAKHMTVIFMSDKGGFSTNKQTKGGPTSNLPLQQEKHGSTTAASANRFFLNGRGDQGRQHLQRTCRQHRFLSHNAPNGRA